MQPQLSSLWQCGTGARKWGQICQPLVWLQSHYNLSLADLQSGVVQCVPGSWHLHQGRWDDLPLTETTHIKSWPKGGPCTWQAAVWPPTNIPDYQWWGLSVCVSLNPFCFLLNVVKILKVSWFRPQQQLALQRGAVQTLSWQQLRSPEGLRRCSLAPGQSLGSGVTALR